MAMHRKNIMKPRGEWKKVKVDPQLFSQPEMKHFVCLEELKSYSLIHSKDEIKLSTHCAQKNKKILQSKKTKHHKLTSKIDTPEVRKAKVLNESNSSKKKRKKKLKSSGTNETHEQMQSDLSNAVESKSMRNKRQRKCSDQSSNSDFETTDKIASHQKPKKRKKGKKVNTPAGVLESENVDEKVIIQKKVKLKGKKADQANAACGDVILGKKRGRFVSVQGVQDLGEAELRNDSSEARPAENKRKRKGDNGPKKKKKKPEKPIVEKQKKKSNTPKKLPGDNGPKKKKKKPEKTIVEKQKKKSDAPKKLPDMCAWKQLYVPGPVLQALAELGFTSPMPIQALTLPHAIRDSMDIVGAAQTGSGKTLAFGIPLLHRILAYKQRQGMKTEQAMEENTLETADTVESEGSSCEEEEAEVDRESKQTSHGNHGERKSQRRHSQTASYVKHKRQVESEVVESDEDAELSDADCTDDSDLADDIDAAAPDDHSDTEASEEEAVNIHEMGNIQGCLGVQSVDEEDEELESDEESDTEASDIDDAEDEEIEGSDDSTDDDADDSVEEEHTIHELPIGVDLAALPESPSGEEYDLSPDEEELEDLDDDEFGCLHVENNVAFEWLEEENNNKITPSNKHSVSHQEGSGLRPLHALVLTPTRELAIQVKNHIEAVAVHTGIKVAVVVGGMSSQKQERVLKKCPEIVVATPGRLWELIQEGDGHLSKVKDIGALVIDEADRMVEKGHFQELTQLLELINEDEKKKSKRQTFVFSATLTLIHGGPNRPMKKKKKKITTNQKLESLMGTIGIKSHPKVVDLSARVGMADNLTEARITCEMEEKDLYLYYLLRQYPGRTLVFTNTKDAVRRLVSVLTLLDCKPLPLHADMAQRQRLKNLDRFKDNEHGLLLATDVAARGLDIPRVQHVIHFQVPKTTENYVHRSGRTARAFNDGLSVLLVCPKETSDYRKIIRTLKREDDLPAFPVEADFIPGLKARVTLARHIDKKEHSQLKQEKQNSWFEKAARDMDIALDEQMHLHDLGDSESRASEKHKLQYWRWELKALLKQPIIPQRFSGKYPTKSGHLEVPFMSVEGPCSGGAINAVKNDKRKGLGAFRHIQTGRVTKHHMKPSHKAKVKKRQR